MCVCHMQRVPMAAGERAASLGDQQLTEERSGRQPCLTVLPSRLFLANILLMTAASVSQHKSCTSSDVCALVHTQPYPLPPHYRPHPLKHISDSRHCTSFLHTAHTHTHAPDVSETFTDHMQAHANMNTYTHRSILTST